MVFRITGGTEATLSKESGGKLVAFTAHTSSNTNSLGGYDSVEGEVVAHWYCKNRHSQGTIKTNIQVSTWTQDSGLIFSFLNTFPFKLLSLPSVLTLKVQPGGVTASSAQGALCPPPSGKEALFPNIACKRKLQA